MALFQCGAYKVGQAVARAHRRCASVQLHAHVRTWNIFLYFYYIFISAAVATQHAQQCSQYTIISSRTMPWVGTAVYTMP
jgi:hypothetical protein